MLPFRLYTSSCVNKMNVIYGKSHYFLESPYFDRIYSKVETTPVLELNT